MPGRNRRVRIIALFLFVAVVWFFYSKSPDYVDDYRQYLQEKTIGGGSVLRAKPEPREVPLKAPSPQEESAPPREPQSLERPHPTTTATTAETTSTTSTPTPTLTPTPPPRVGFPLEPVQLKPPTPPPEDDLPYQVGKGRVEVEDVPSFPTTTIHWSRQPDHFPIDSTIALPTGTSKPFPRIQRAVSKLMQNGADEEKRAIVKAAGVHGWKGYRDHAFPQDEVRPISGLSNNPFNGWGATLVDSLDTLWILGLKDEFDEAVHAVANIDFTTSIRADIPLFETVIRYLGGLVSAYDVSGRKYITLLDKAVQLAEVLYAAFDTPNRVPLTYYRWRPSFTSQPHRAGNRVVLAEIGTLSLEFTRLAQLTGEPKYYDAIARLTDMFEDWQNSTRIPGMFPTTFDASGCGKPAQVASTPTTHDEKNQQQIPDGTTSQVENGIIPPPQNEVDWRTADLDAEMAAVKAAGKPELPPPADGVGLDSKAKRQLDEENTEKMRIWRDQFKVGGALERKPAEELCIPQGFASVSKNAHETFTLGGASDSMYEYLPKEYLLLGGQVEKYRTMYLDSAAAAIERLLFRPMTPDERDILVSGTVKLAPNYSQPIEEREFIETYIPELAHLTCFAGGMFAMGGVLFDKPEHVEIGSKLTDGCVWAYNATATGIMPETATLMQCENTWAECKWNETAYWQQLDPYAETRMGVPETVQVEVVPANEPLAQRTKDTDSDFGRMETFDDANDAPPLRKRQLGEPALDDLRPPEPAPLVPPTPQQPATSSEEPSAMYTPPPPPSHEDFVKKKIEEERLPPGYTKISSRKYILRPEAIESVFYMYRITGDQYWRDVGWNMFMSIERYTRTNFGNSAIDDVSKQAPEMMDQMESFWMAETIKYFYLLFDDPETWSLDEWVLNTEAHPFRRPPFEFAAM